VELVSTLNRKLDKENRKLLRQQQSPLCSADKNRNSASAKVKVPQKERSKHCEGKSSYVDSLFDSNLGVLFCLQSNKRKSPKTMSSPVEKRLEFSSPEISRKPLSPVWNNSPDSKMNNN